MSQKLAAIVVSFWMTIPACQASQTWCGVFDKSADSFLMLRAAPSAAYQAVGAVGRSDLMYIGTEECRGDLGVGAAEFGSAICRKDKNWVFVEEVMAVDQSKKGLKGWANSRFIRQIGCPD